MAPDRTDSPDRARLEARVRGRVQGVGYRAFVLDEAARLDLSGWVANEPDGSVRLEAEGRRADLDLLVAHLWDGPPAAWVDDVAVTWMAVIGRDDGFRLRSGWHLGD